MNTLLGKISFFIWLFINKNKSWNLNIFIPQAVEPAQPPINIKKRKKINGNFPHKLKSLVTYPVPDKIDSDKRHLILGGQANLWTEYIPTTEKAEYMLLPRMCALAETVWSPRNKRNYTDFIDRLGDHLKRLDRKNLNYRKLDQ